MLRNLASLSPVVRPQSHNSLVLRRLLPCLIYIGHSNICSLLHLLFLLRQMLLDWCQSELVGRHVVSELILRQAIIVSHIKRIDQWSLGTTLWLFSSIIYLPAIRIRFSSLDLFRAYTPSWLRLEQKVRGCRCAHNCGLSTLMRYFARVKSQVYLEMMELHCLCWWIRKTVAGI